jgi:hypothetical protein
MKSRTQNADGRWILRPSKLWLRKARKDMAFYTADLQFIAPKSLLNAPIEDADLPQGSQGWTLQNDANSQHSPIRFAFDNLSLDSLLSQTDCQAHPGNAASHNENISYRRHLFASPQP